MASANDIERERDLRAQALRALVRLLAKEAASDYVGGRSRPHGIGDRPGNDA